MKNLQLAKKIKELRKNKGFSQETLSETAQLNLRTIQRIEAGETEARGDTLKRLAAALTVSPNDLVDWTEEEDKGFLFFLNLSALSFIAYPILGVIVPLTLWGLKKDKIKHLDETGKKLLNFQISWCILFFIAYIPFFLTVFFHFSPLTHLGIHMELGAGSMYLMMLISPLYYLINIVYIVINAIRSYKDKTVFYKPAIPFLR